MMPKTHARISSKGFTLIELLVVVGIVGALVGVSLGTINVKRQQEYAQDASLRSNVEKACAGIKAYYEAENATYPDDGDNANPLDTSASNHETAAFYIQTWPEGLLYSLSADGSNFSVYAQRASNTNYFVCGSNWPVVRECADGTDVSDPTACTQVGEDLFEFAEPGEYIAPAEPENPCNNNSCDIDVDCSCTDPLYGDCDESVCVDLCDNNICDENVDCNCTNPLYGDCGESVCVDPCDDNKCENPATECSACPYGDDCGNQCKCYDGICEKDYDCKICGGTGNCTTAQCLCGNNKCDPGECDTCKTDCTGKFDCPIVEDPGDIVIISCLYHSDCDSWAIENCNGYPARCDGSSIIGKFKINPGRCVCDTSGGALW